MTAATPHPRMQQLQELTERHAEVSRRVFAIKLRGAVMRLRGQALRRAVDDVLARPAMQAKGAVMN